MARIEYENGHKPTGVQQLMCVDGYDSYVVGSTGVVLFLAGLLVGYLFSRK